MDSTILFLYYKCVPAGVLYLYSYFSSPSNLENWELKADQSRIEGRNPGWDLRVYKMFSASARIISTLNIWLMWIHLTHLTVQIFLIILTSLTLLKSCLCCLSIWALPIVKASFAMLVWQVFVAGRVAGVQDVDIGETRKLVWRGTEGRVRGSTAALVLRRWLGVPSHQYLLDGRCCVAPWAVKHHLDLPRCGQNDEPVSKSPGGEDAQNHQCLVSILFDWKVVSRLSAGKKQYVCKFHRKSTPLCKTCNDTLGHQISYTLMMQDEIVAAKGELSDANTKGQIAAAKEKEADLISLQELAKSDPQQAAAKGLAEGMIHSEILTEAAKALMDSEVQSKFHQLHMASHVFMIIPLVHTSTSRGSHALGEEVVNLINGGSLAWKNIKGEMQAAISHSGGSDIIAFENVPTTSRKFATSMENTTMKNFKAAARTEATKVKVHVMDQLDTYNPIQLQERKYIFLPLIGAILVIPLLVALGCEFDSSKYDYVRVQFFPPPLLQAFCIFGPPTAAHFGWVDCGVGVPWELHTAFAVLVAVYAFSRLVWAGKDYFQEKANGKMCEWMCECCPPLPYCGIEAGQREPVPKKGMTLRVDDVDVIIIPHVRCGILKSNNLTCFNMFQVDINSLVMGNSEIPGWTQCQSGQLFACLCCACVQVSGACQDWTLRGGLLYGTLWFLLGCGFRMHLLQLPLGVGQCVCCGSGDGHLGPSRGNGGRWPPRSSAATFVRLRSPSDGLRRPPNQRRPSGSRRRPRLGTGGAGGFAPGGGGWYFHDFPMIPWVFWNLEHQIIVKWSNGQ